MIFIKQTAWTWENGNDKVTIVLGFASKWLRELREFSEPIFWSKGKENHNNLKLLSSINWFLKNVTNIDLYCLGKRRPFHKMRVVKRDHLLTLRISFLYPTLLKSQHAMIKRVK